MNLIRAKSIEKGWDLEFGELARIWKGDCIIRAVFLDRIKKAYDRNPDLANLLVDPDLAYFDTYRTESLPVYFGAHTYERVDIEGSFHTAWFKIARQLN
ncbi:6-phosphogluconate dehydrogenase, decarboxylating 2-like [Hevea brasiliensis]|uniref:6-phosphogluconate dehydrogenase, decarboxylating 2-like n=1 Tax=Hevea brasiliensis TaxID=3981 RepID=UPI0025D5029E|nr:6-phosphogluconate dehydrogenase, decarboxylating 2-like [Hevea brasiliensis]